MQRVSVAFLFIFMSCALMSACGRNVENNSEMPDNMSTSQTAVETDTASTASPAIASGNAPTESHAAMPDASGNGENDSLIYGKWKIIEQTGSGYIYGEVSLDDYIGGVITIDKDYIESDIRLGRHRLENPRYKIKQQNKYEFYMVIHSDYSSFGFKDDTPTMIEVHDGSDDWGEFGTTFWIRDEKHLIFLGPVFFLAERME